MSRSRALIALTLVVLFASATVAVAAHIKGTDGPDGLVGTPAGDHIDARAGNDVIFGLGGDDKIKAGKGDDDIDGDGQCPPGATDPTYCQHGGGGEGCDGKRSAKHGHGHGHGHGHDECDDHHHGHGHGHGHGACPPGTKDPTYCENVDGDDWIKAGPGDDTVRAGGGDDRIGGGTGEDTIDAGTGDDKIYVRDFEPDVIDCGPGYDQVIADRSDVLSNCEWISVPRGGGHHH